MNITLESTLLSSEENEYFIFFTWKYSGGIEIEDFTTQLFTDDKLCCELSVPANERSGTCKIARQESSIYVVMITANGFCGDSMTNSATITFENASKYNTHVQIAASTCTVPVRKYLRKIFHGISAVHTIRK